METVLAPLTFGSGPPQRFLGITQFLGDSYQVGGAPIALQRLLGSKLIREGESLHSDMDPPGPPPFESRRSSRAPHLRLVVSRNGPTLHCDLDRNMRRVIENFEVSSITSLVR
jgi:hypothetical protein